MSSNLELMPLNLHISAVFSLVYHLIEIFLLLRFADLLQRFQSAPVSNATCSASNCPCKSPWDLYVENEILKYTGISCLLVAGIAFRVSWLVTLCEVLQLELHVLHSMLTCPAYSRTILIRKANCKTAKYPTLTFFAYS